MNLGARAPSPCPNVESPLNVCVNVTSASTLSTSALAVMFWANFVRAVISAMFVKILSSNDMHRMKEYFHYGCAALR